MIRLQSIALLAVLFACGGDNRDGISLEEYAEQVVPYTLCEPGDPCVHSGFRARNPCVCNLAFNNEYREAVFELVDSVTCSRDEEPTGLCGTSSLAVCNESGVCEAVLAVQASP